jgi:hypothetical protein
MKYAFELGSGAIIHRPSFIWTRPGVQKFIQGGHRYTGRTDIA